MIISLFFLLKIIVILEYQYNIYYFSLLYLYLFINYRQYILFFIPNSQFTIFFIPVVTDYK